MEESARLSEPWTLCLAESAEAGVKGEWKLRQGFTTRWSRDFSIISSRVRQVMKIQELELRAMWQLSSIPAQQ